MTEKKVLVAYTTNSGSTEEVAREIAARLNQTGWTVDIHRFEQVSTLDSYQAVVIGAPMILGYHRDALRFMKKHQEQLRQKPVALFATAMSLTSIEDQSIGDLALSLDPALAARPKNPKWLSIKERYTSVSNYLRMMTGSVSTIKPVSVAIFAGKLELFRLKWWQVLFVMLVVRARPGDLRNWSFIEQWGDLLNTRLK